MKSGNCKLVLKKRYHYGIFNRKIKNHKKQITCFTGGKYMICQKCGSEIKEGQQFCANCGAPVEKPEPAPQQLPPTPPVMAAGQSTRNTSQQAPQPTVSSPAAHKITEEDLPASLKPISTWGYFGYTLLFSIPCIGFIFLCVFALGGTQKVNLRNLARSYFCHMLVAILIGLAAAVATLITGASVLVLPELPNILNRIMMFL